MRNNSLFNKLIIALIFTFVCACDNSGAPATTTNTVDTPAVVEKLTVEPAQDTAPDKLLASIDKDLNEGKVVVVYKNEQ